MKAEATDTTQKPHTLCGFFYLWELLTCFLSRVNKNTPACKPHGGG